MASLQFWPAQISVCQLVELLGLSKVLGLVLRPKLILRFTGQAILVELSKDKYSMSLKVCLLKMLWELLVSTLGISNPLGVMLGKSLSSSVWWIAPWALLSQIIYMGSYLVSSLFG